MFSAENVEGHLEVMRGQIAKHAWIHMTHLSIFWYMIELCVPYRGNQLSLQSDTRFSSYNGSKVGFDTFLAITLCVYIGAYNNFKTECTSSKGTFLILWKRIYAVMQRMCMCMCVCVCVTLAREVAREHDKWKTQGRVLFILGWCNTHS